MNKPKINTDVVHSHADKHPKQDFQVERIAFFSDAVFAIAITLLIIEFKIPEVNSSSTYSDILQQVLELKYKFIALTFSFIFIIVYWMRHHTLFKYIHNYNKEIIVANMISLFPIIFFPFTTSFFYASTAFEQVVIIPFRLFMLNNIIAGAAFCYLYWVVIKKHQSFSFTIEKADEIELSKRQLIMTVSFTMVFILSFFTTLQNAIYGMMPFAVLQFYYKYLKGKSKDTKSKMRAGIQVKE